MKTNSLDLLVFRLALYATLGAMTGMSLYHCLELVYEILLTLAMRVHWVP